MSTPTSSHAYGIGVIALIVGMSVSVVFLYFLLSS